MKTDTARDIRTAKKSFRPQRTIQKLENVTRILRTKETEVEQNQNPEFEEIGELQVLQTTTQNMTSMENNVWVEKTKTKEIEDTAKPKTKPHAVR